MNAWQELAANAVEPNIFYEPWSLLPAWQEFPNHRVRVAFVFGHDRRLIAVFPLISGRGYRQIPVTTLSLWRHLHCPLCTPLVLAGREYEALTAFFGWMRSNPFGASLFLFDHITADGPFSGQLDRALVTARRRSYEHERWERAMIRPAGDPEQYLERALASKRRRELRRQSNRLSEQGDLTCVELTPGDHLTPWLDDFLALEQAGWKGRDGTAIASRDTERHYFERVAGAAFERGQLMMLALKLDGRPIAMKCNFLDRDGGYAAKIAYDESFASYSPGVQLELHHLRLLHTRPHIRWMDSCAVPNHFMKERLWTERRPMRTVLISTGGLLGNTIVSALPLAEGAWRRLKRAQAASD
ncbi:MAG: GNAT family N-acetyltransferase [Candidatus Zixiibacteriota bacterium]